LGANVKVALFPTGYGGDLAQAGPNASQVAQGVYFTIGSEPVELHTSATELFQKYSQAAGVTGEPTEASYDGWSSIGLLVQALKAAGSQPTSGSLLTALSNIHSWNNLGLWGGKSLDINDRNNTQVNGAPGNCSYMVKYSGNAFVPVTGADPICGTIIPGLNETPS
jgi:branched-chain amino acid transport system substrate-binding protein